MGCTPDAAAAKMRGMALLWTVDVLNRGEDWVELRVQQQHPAAGPMPASKAFALRLLCELAHGADSSSVATSALGVALPRADALRDGALREHADRFVASARVHRLVNAPFNEAAARATVDARVEARGIERDDIEWKDVWQEEWTAWWDSPDGPPIATLRIVAAEPRWLEHIAPGQHFETAASEAAGEYVRTNRDEELAFPPDARVNPVRFAFPLSYRARTDRGMNTARIEATASASEPLAGDALRAAIAAHHEFLATGGRGGVWQTYSMGEMPKCFYYGCETADGEQLVLNGRRLAAKTSLAELDLAHCDLSGSIARDVVFRAAKLDGCTMVDAFFDGADFSGASLRKTDLSGASLRGCSFRGADLTGADFEHTDCTGADFTDAILVDARFPGALLDEVKR